MTKSNTKKKKQLGIAPSTASARMRKSLLFSLVKRLGDNFCFQCGAEIITEEELSIEHKVPWLYSKNPKELFYDLNNITFSHLSCNIKARRSVPLPHPSRTSYLYGCRCKGCIQVNSDYKRKLKLKITC